MNRSVFGITYSEEDAQRIIDHLMTADFDKNNISVIFPEKANSSKGHLGYEKNSKAPEGASVGAAVGGLFGGSLGLLAGIGAISLPGLGAFIAAGPLMAALSGSAIGGSLGLLGGTLVGMGIPEYEAKYLQDSLNAGKFLISVHTENNEDLERAKEILESEGASHIASTIEL